MNIHRFFIGQPLLLDFGQTSLKVWQENRIAEWPLERTDTGRLASGCKDRLKGEIRSFLAPNWLPGCRAVCAIPARGVNIRKLQLPPGISTGIPSLLAFQVEKEFPLPPDQIAWAAFQPPTNSSASPESEWAVVAVKRDMVQDYVDILKDCKCRPELTLGPLAAAMTVEDPSGSFAVLDIGKAQSQCITFQDGKPSQIRILPWGGENLTSDLSQFLQLNRNDAEQLKLQFSEGTLSDSSQQGKIGECMESGIAELYRYLAQVSLSKECFLCGRTSRLKGVEDHLNEWLPSTSFQRLNISSDTGFSAVLDGMQRFWLRTEAESPLVLKREEPATGERAAWRPLWQWTGIAVALLLVLLALRYAEAFKKAPELSAALHSFTNQLERLDQIDQELSFLQHLEANQPPYIDVLSVLAHSAPNGMEIETLNMARNRELSMRGLLRNPNQAVEFRSQLVATGFFDSIRLEEQAPGPNRKFVIRIQARFKSLDQLPDLPEGIVPDSENESPPPSTETTRNPPQTDSEANPVTAVLPLSQPSTSPKN